MPTDIQATTNSVSLSGRKEAIMPASSLAFDSSPIQGSIELAAKVESALKIGEEKGWGMKEVSTSEPLEDILSTSINIFNEPSNKPAIIAHNAYATRGFIGVSQKLPVSSMRCNGIELDFSYLRNELIVSHRKQSYLGIINPFASAANLDAIIKQLPTALENNNAIPDNKFIISLGDFLKKETEQNKMLSDITTRLTKNLKKKDIDCIRLVTTAKVSSELINRCQEKGIELSYNAINEMVIARHKNNSTLSLMKKEDITDGYDIVDHVKKFRSKPEGLVKLLKSYPELIEPFRSMEKDFGAYFSVYPKSNWLVSSTNPNKKAMHELIKMGVLKEIKLDNVPSIHDLSANNSTYCDIIEHSKDATAFQNIGNDELRYEQYKNGVPRPYDGLDIAVTSFVIGLLSAGLGKANQYLQKKGKNKAVKYTCDLASILYNMSVYLSFSNAFADTKTGLALSILSPFFPPVAQLTTEYLAEKGIVNKENIPLRLLSARTYLLHATSHLLYTSSYFSNGYFSSGENAKAFGCSVVPYIISNIAVNELYLLYLTRKDSTRETEGKHGNEESVALQVITIEPSVSNNRGEQVEQQQTLLEHNGQLPPSSSLSICNRMHRLMPCCNRASYGISC